MPRPIGSPVTVTITNGQPMREVVRFTADISYATDGTPVLSFSAHSSIRLRTAAGVIVQDDKQYKPLASFDDTSMPAQLRTALVNILTRLDTLPDPS